MKFFSFNLLLLHLLLYFQLGHSLQEMEIMMQMDMYESQNQMIWGNQNLLTVWCSPKLSLNPQGKQPSYHAFILTKTRHAFCIICLIKE